ncbi:NERD domain-containing protein [Thiohalomonas denitrificans]|uniref:Nuclease-related domain-containing protein n=1 Tax=Thiohalomonas denitrificans TaxID=415747 RepID=A0A1G5R0R5_9GAMM|nr:NERD domain-containing protein [Thiohalomonas denitrificans]SCZ67622.1 Nuclease-related domain-containing protein [Thiohalomonas denitrificans]
MPQSTLTRPWHWEGNVQATLRTALEEDDWTITAAANIETKEPGIDLSAVKDDRVLHIEVKGYPSTTYEHGARREFYMDIHRKKTKKSAPPIAWNGIAASDLCEFG